jgi:Uma2 family endonuclease
MYAEKIRLTYEDYALIPDDGRHHEIIDGERHVSPSPRTRHQRLVGALFALLRRHVKAQGLGEVYVAPFDVLLSDHDVVQPDVLFVSDARLHIVDEENCKGAPDLLVEVLSEGMRRYDLQRKRALYERAGVQEYWVVDPGIDEAPVFRAEGGRYAPPGILSAEAGDALSSPLLPGLALPLPDMFA